jgi:RNA polymerase sigma-32 factor
MAKTPRRPKKNEPQKAGRQADVQHRPVIEQIDPSKVEIIDAPINDSSQEVPGGIPDEVAYDAVADAAFDAEAAFLRKVEEEDQQRTPARASSSKLVKASLVEAPSSESNALVSAADPVTAYLAEIRRYSLLTREQEHELAIRYRETGDPKAAEILVTSNLRFVVKVAAEYSRFGAKLIDLIQEGNVGLMHAVREFNPYKNVRLITYAVWWIRGYIQEYLMRQYSLVRIGTTQNQRKLFYRLQKEREALDAAGQEPNYALLAGRLGVSEEEVETMSQRLSGRDVSLNQPLDGENSVASLLDYEASNEESVDDQLGRAEEIEVLKRNLEIIRPSLSTKEIYLLDERILSEDPLTLQEIGDHYGVTREAVRQLEARLLAKIRTAMAQSLDQSKTSTRYFHQDPKDEE